MTSTRTRAATPIRLALAIAMLATLTTAGESSRRVRQPSEAERVDWLRRHVVPVRSILPADEDFSDLAPLVRAIGDARIVALGEATHGDGAAFLAKTRLVKFLHQVMGFDVLAWESGLMDCRSMDAALRSSVPVRQATRGIYRAWHESEQLGPLFEYLRASHSTPRPIATAGFDCKFSSPGVQQREYAEYVFAFFDRLDATLLSAQDRADFRRLCATVNPVDYYRKPGRRDLNLALVRRLLQYLESERTRILAVTSAREVSFVKRTLENLVDFEAWLSNIGNESAGATPVPHRDALMGRNLLWMAREQFPDRKIIVWTHNYHAMAGLYVARTEEALTRAAASPLGGSMGMHVRRAMGNAYYTIGFVGYTGKWGYNGDEITDIPPAAPGTLDALLHQTGHKQLLLDFRSVPAGHWLRGLTKSRFYFWTEAETIWSRIYDGVFFIDEMQPSTRARDLPGK